MATDERGHDEHSAERRHLCRIVVPNQRGDRQQSGEGDQHRSHPAVEAPGLEPRPLVERADNLAPVVRVGAGVLARAGVADLRLASIAQQPALVVVLVEPQMLALWANPGVEVLVVGEAGGAVALAAIVRVPCEQVEDDSSGDEEEPVAGCEHDLGVEGAHELASDAPTGSVISVKRMSSGSSSVTCFTV